MADANTEHQELDPDKLDNLLESESASIAEDDENSAFERAISGEPPEPREPEPKASGSSDDDDQDTDTAKAEAQQQQQGAQGKEEGADKDKGGDKGAQGTENEQGAQEQQVDMSYVRKLEARVRNMEGRFGTLNSQLQRASQSTQAQGAEAPSKEQIKEAAQNSDKLDELKKDFPEWSEALTEQLGLTKKELSSDFISKTDFQDALKQATDEARSQALAEMQEQLVDFKHPGWKTTVATPEFNQWLQGQDENTLALAQSKRSADAIQLLDEYEASKESQNRPADEEQRQAQKQKNQKKLEASMSPTQGATVQKPRPMTEDEAFAAAAKRTHNGG